MSDRFYREPAIIPPRDDVIAAMDELLEEAAHAGTGNLAENMADRWLDGTMRRRLEGS